MTQVTNINLWPAQREFFEAGPQPTLFMGGVGSGKSFVLVLKMLYLLDQFPGSRGLIARQRFSQLKKTTSATLFKLLPASKIAKRNANDGTLTLTNGSELLLMHLDSVDSLSNLKSLEISFGAIDQCEDISAEAFDTLYERIGRWSGAKMRGGWPADWPYKNRMGENVPPRYFFANCYSPGFDSYLAARFWEFGSERERYRKQGYRVIIGSTTENQALSDDYIQSRLDMGDEYVQRFVHASEWGAKEGRIFDLRPISVVEPDASLLYRIHNTMRLHRVLDHGEAENKHTVCLWYATDNADNVYFYREYGAKGLLVSDHREMIYKLSMEDMDTPRYYSDIADPSIFNKTRGRTATSAPTYGVRDEYLDRRIVDPKTAISWGRANNDEEMTVNRVKEYLRCDPRHRHPSNGQIGSPRVFFLKRTPDYKWGCHETMVDIQAARRIAVGTAPDGSKMFGDKRDEAVRDDFLDCVRYALAGRPALAPNAPDPQPEPGVILIEPYLKQMEDEARQAKREAGYVGKTTSYGY